MTWKLHVSSHQTQTSISVSRWLGHWGSTEWHCRHTLCTPALYTCYCSFSALYLHIVIFATINSLHCKSQDNLHLQKRAAEKIYCTYCHCTVFFNSFLCMFIMAALKSMLFCCLAELKGKSGIKRNTALQISYN